MPPLLLLASALGLNYARHRRGRSTICSTCRPHIRPEAMAVIWAGITVWFLPHYGRPVIAAAARAALELIDDAHTIPFESEE